MNVMTDEVKMFLNEESAKKEGFDKEAVASVMTRLQQQKLKNGHTVTIHRTQPCPCGSGKKYKNCCRVWND